MSCFLQKITSVIMGYGDDNLNDTHGWVDRGHSPVRKNEPNLHTSNPKMTAIEIQVRERMMKEKEQQEQEKRKCIAFSSRWNS